MAFKQDLPTVQASKAPGVQTGDTSNVTRIGVLENIIGSVSNGLANQRAKDIDAVQSDAIVGLMELEDERASMLERESNLQARRQSFFADDGQLSAEERAQLKTLEEETQLLNQARESGILNPQGFSTRFNNLMRQSLARAENLGIQTQIAQLFSARRSQSFAEPAMTPEQKQFKARMDAQFPDGWDQAKAAEFLGKQQYVSSVLSKPDFNPRDISQSMVYQIEEVLNRAKAAVGPGGRLLTDEEKIQIGDTIGVMADGQRKALRNKIKVLRQTGQFSAAQEQKLDAAFSAIDAQVQFYSNDIWDTKLMKDRGYNETVKRSLELQNNLIEASIPANVKTLQKFFGGEGEGGGAQGLVMAAMTNADDPIWSLFAEQDPLGRDATQLRDHYTGLISKAMSVDHSIKSLVDQKLIPSEMLMITQHRVNKQPAKTVDELSEKIKSSGSSYSINVSEPTTARQAMLGYAKDLKILHTEAKRHGKEGELSNSTKNYFKDNASKIVAYAKEKGLGEIKVTAEGRIVAPTTVLPDVLPSSPFLGTDVPQVDNTKNLRTMLEGYDRAFTEAQSLGIVDQDFNTSLFGAQEVQPEAETEQATQPDQSLERGRIEERLRRLNERLEKRPNNKRIQGDIEFFENQLNKLSSGQPTGPDVGSIMEDEGVQYRFKGGDPSIESNWEVLSNG